MTDASTSAALAEGIRTSLRLAEWARLSATTEEVEEGRGVERFASRPGGLGLERRSGGLPCADDRLMGELGEGLADRVFVVEAERLGELQ